MFTGNPRVHDSFQPSFVLQGRFAKSLHPGCTSEHSGTFETAKDPYFYEERKNCVDCKHGQLQRGQKELQC